MIKIIFYILEKYYVGILLICAFSKTFFRNFASERNLYPAAVSTFHHQLSGYSILFLALRQAIAPHICHSSEKRALRSTF